MKRFQRIVHDFASSFIACSIEQNADIRQTFLVRAKAFFLACPERGVLKPELKYLSAH
ncbi:hypothetical protein [Ruegeria sp. EL01]|uniref:hypothetical protein n=1 Tax=Ruegeria sp. EL01 TaxID=2107578 RepID=UPI0013C44502|nr:hypothetical protein [Ruegeria sp. EL01]